MTEREQLRWYAAALVFRFFPVDKKYQSHRSITVGTESIRLICAATPGAAYARAMEIGRSIGGSECKDYRERKGVWQFLGLAELSLVDGKLGEEECEAIEIWHRRTIKSIESMVEDRKELDAFLWENLPDTQD